MNKLSTLVVFLILGLVAPIFASGPCNCQTLPPHTGTIIGDLGELLDEVVSDVIEPLGSAVSSLVDNLLSELDLDDVLGSGVLGSNVLNLNGLLGSSGVVGGLLESDGVVGGLLESDGVVGGLLESDGLVDNVVSAVDDLLDDLLDGDVDISLCVGLDLLQNNLFYHFNSGNNNHIVLYGFSSNIALNVALFTGGCSDLTCVFVDLDFCGESNDLAIVVQPNTDYYIGIFGAPCDFIINYELSCHGRCH
jgi:hypothetical protein